MSDIGRTAITESIGEVPESVTDPALRSLLESMIMAHDIAAGRQGKGTNGRYVTIQDLVASGLIPDGKIT